MQHIVQNSLWIQNQYKDWSNPASKIEQLTKNNKITRLKRGLFFNTDYLENRRSLYYAANVLYGPSYISFLFALRWYGLIPEHVVEFTSATYKKRRNKNFSTGIGRFTYRDIPSAAYPFSVVLETVEKPFFLIASAEKALCDQLYTAKGIRSLRSIEEYLFEDLRIDADEFKKLDPKLLYELSDKYNTETHQVFKKYLKGKNA